MDAIIKQTWLEAISFLSENMQNRIIGIVTRYQLLGTLPEKMSRTVVIAVRMILADLGVDVSKIVPSTGATTSEEKENTADEQVSDVSANISQRSNIQTITNPRANTTSSNVSISSLPRKQKKLLKKMLHPAV